MSKVKLDKTGLTTPSISLGDNTLSSDGNKLLWNGEELKSAGGSGSSGHNVGEQWISMDGTIPFGGLAFLGQTVSKETYIELYNWVEANGRFKTEAEWQSLYTANNGNVSFYAKVDDTSFRLPSFKGYLKANETGGGYTKEGLPNITGSAEIPDNVVTNTNSAKIFAKSNGAFHQTTKSSGPRAWATTGISVSTWEDGRNIEFSAQKSNNIYGASSHVTPETNTILIGVYAFNTILNDANVEVDTIRQRVDELETLTKHAVGEQWISFDGTIPLGGIPFDGRSIERSLYPDLVKWIQDNNRAISKSDYQTRLSNNYSNVPYYVLEADTITMPIYRGYLYFNSNNTAGTYIKQGLPNISGFINEAYGGYGAWEGSGAFSVVNGSNVSTRGGGGGNVNDKDITFNASKSNSIYGASSDVRPHTTCILVGVYAFNTISNQSNIDLETFRQTMATGLSEGIIPCFPVSTTVPPYTNKLCVQKASKDNAPNNGIILSTYTNTNWHGQLFIGDNANQGLYIRGVSDAVQGPWKRVLHLENSALSGNWYRKYSDGLIIQSGTIATTSGDRDTSTITLPTAFTSANYYANVMLENVDMNGGGGMWTVKSKTTTSFIIHNGQDTTGTFRWFAIGY